MNLILFLLFTTAVFLIGMTAGAAEWREDLKKLTEYIEKLEQQVAAKQ